MSTRKDEGHPDPELNESIKQARLRCYHCNGAGWISVEGPYGTSAAYPCYHRSPTESEQRMGVRIPPHSAVEAHYQAEHREVPARMEKQAEFARSHPKWSPGSASGTGAALIQSYKSILGLKFDVVNVIPEHEHTLRRRLMRSISSAAGITSDHNRSTL